MKRSARKDFLDQLVKANIIKPESAQALIQSCDPFHDFSWSPTGLPDGYSGKSIVRVVKKSVQISSPFSDKTIPFDCHIMTLPEFVAYQQYTTTPDANMSVTEAGNATFSSSAQFPVAPFVYVTGAVGADTTPANGTNVEGAGGNVNFVEYNDYISGQSRVISSALEVHNVTNELNVSGTSTVYRLPQSEDTSTIRFIPGGTPSTADPVPRYETLISRCPPAQLSDMLLLPDTKQWEAKYGCYLCDTYDLESIRPSPQSMRPHLFLNGDFGKTYAPSNSLNGFGRGVNVDADNFCYTSTAKPIKKNTSGVLFSGLNGQTQLTLTTIMVIETFPSPVDPLVTLARNTPDFDPMFFQLYKQIANSLAPGVMVGENASGDFWKKILGVVRDFAPAIGSVFGPVGGALGNLASTAAKGGIARIESRASAAPQKLVSYKAPSGSVPYVSNAWDAPTPPPRPTQFNRPAAQPRKIKVSAKVAAAHNQLKRR